MQARYKLLLAYILQSFIVAGYLTQLGVSGNRELLSRNQAWNQLQDDIMFAGSSRIRRQEVPIISDWTLVTRDSLPGKPQSDQEDRAHLESGSPNHIVRRLNFNSAQQSSNSQLTRRSAPPVQSTEGLVVRSQHNSQNEILSVRMAPEERKSSQGGRKRKSSNEGGKQNKQVSKEEQRPFEIAVKAGEVEQARKRKGSMTTFTKGVKKLPKGIRKLPKVIKKKQNDVIANTLGLAGSTVSGVGNVKSGNPYAAAGGLTSAGAHAYKLGATLHEGVKEELDQERERTPSPGGSRRTTYHTGRE
ncbi:hypothetical protein MMC10_008731 [Thelotrema lepadinum]|nr:hypothetical protein [Thelotrema lepadinum]